MTNPPFVSVVMTAYNEQQYVAEAVQSILDQTYREFQLIVVDDASQDATPEILQRLARSDSRIEVYRNAENQGIARSANVGLSHAQSSLVARMDSDDVSLPQRLRAQVDTFASRPELVLCGGSTIRVDAARRPRAIGEWPRERDAIRWYAIFRPPVAQSAAMFRYDAKTRDLQYDEALNPADDFGMWSRLLQRGEIEILPTPLIQYREHKRNATHTRRRQMTTNAAIVCRGNLLQVLPAFFEEHGETAATSIANLVERNPLSGPTDIGQTIELLFAAERSYLASTDALPKQTRHAIQQLTARWLVQALASPDVAPRAQRLKAALALRRRIPRLLSEAVDFLNKRIRAKRF